MNVRMIGFVLLVLIVDIVNGQASTALQRHAEFFDTNLDGIITVGETRRGLQRLGLGWLGRNSIAWTINLALSSITGSQWSTIDISKIELGKHGGSTNNFDAEGNFDESNLNELLTEFGMNNGNAISETGLLNMLDSLSESFVTSAISRLEWGLLMEFAGEPISGQTDELMLTRDTLLSFYDGSLFYNLANEPVPF